MSKMVIGVFVGSLRRESFCKKVAEVMVLDMPEDVEMKIIDISDLPIYNQDYDDDGNIPEAWTVFRNQVKLLDGVLFITPEYNRSLPPVLKNALDIASRPFGQNVWSGKPGGVVSVSPGKQGGFGANHHLRQIMTCLNVYMMQQPEAYISNITDSWDENGNLTNERTKSFLQSVTGAFIEWVRKF